MAGRRILYGLALVGCLVFYVAYQKWFSWMLLLIMLLFPWLILILSLRTMLRIKLEPGAANRIPQGSEEPVLLITQGPTPLPPRKSKLSVTKPMTGERWILRPGEDLPTKHCGGLLVKPHRPRVYDYLGLFRMKVRKTVQKTVLVMPQPVAVEIPADLTRFLARAWRPKPGGGYAENHEMRPYRPGDNLNQVHWKLSAKVDDLMLREPMEPEQGLMLLTIDLRGTPQELDTKFGRLLWLGSWFLERQISFEVRALTGNGVESWSVVEEWDLQKCVDELLCTTASSADTSIRDRDYTASWQFHIGGEPDET